MTNTEAGEFAANFIKDFFAPLNCSTYLFHINNEVLNITTGANPLANASSIENVEWEPIIYIQNINSGIYMESMKISDFLAKYPNSKCFDSHC